MNQKLSIIVANIVAVLILGYLFMLSHLMAQNNELKRSVHEKQALYLWIQENASPLLKSQHQTSKPDKATIEAAFANIRPTNIILTKNKDIQIKCDNVSYADLMNALSELSYTTHAMIKEAQLEKTDLKETVNAVILL